MKRWRFVLGILIILITVPSVARAQSTPALLALNRCGAGDTVQYTLMVAGAITPEALIPGGIETPSYAPAFAPLRPFLTAGQPGLAFLAGPLAGGPLPALAAELAGQNLILSAAHPRLLDRGPAGVDATLQTLARYAINQHGIGFGGEERPPFLKITIQHPASPLTLGLLSASWGLEGNADPRGQINLLADAAGVLPAIRAAIEQARRETDLVVVMAAWGQPSDPDPAQARRNAARNLIAAGADLVIGSIPGALGPVEWISIDDREGLAIFSTGDLIGAADTPAALFYIGATRDLDGAARITGLRYLPIRPGNGNRGPEPLPAPSRDLSALVGDPGQLHIVAPLPPEGPIAVCPPLLLPEAPETPITGDFARFYQTFGDTQPRSLLDAIALLGLPLGPVSRELAGDCQQEVAVLYTERQRLELHPANPWPYRVQGTHLGVVALRQLYPELPVIRRTEIAQPDTFAHPRFRAFYEQYGGVAMFGYPISDGLTERDPNTGRDLIVQYFERARFELDPAAPLPDDSIWRVRLGLLGREIGARAVSILCPAAIALPPASFPSAIPTAAPPGIDSAAQQSGDGSNWALYLMIALLLVMVGVIIFALFDFYKFVNQSPFPELSAGEQRGGYRSSVAAHSRRSQPDRSPDTGWQGILGRLARRAPSGAAESVSSAHPRAQSSRQRPSQSTGPDWRRVGRTTARQSSTQPMAAGAVPQSSPSLTAQPTQRLWTDEKTPGHQPGARIASDQPVGWDDLPSAERERWMDELGPLADPVTDDIPPAERERWRADLAASSADHQEYDWQFDPPIAAGADASARRLDPAPGQPNDEPSPDPQATPDDDLLRKLLGL